jgi:fatty-acyl-CoA synthase
MNFSDVIIHNGTDEVIKSRTFIMYRDDREKIHEVSYEEFYRRSLEYGNMINQLRIVHGVDESDRFHVGIFMQNIPEFFYILGGCAFTCSTLVGVNNAQVGEKLAFDINNIDMDILFVDCVEQPGTGGTFLDTVIKARDAYGFNSLSDDRIYIIPSDKKYIPDGFTSSPEVLQQYYPSLNGFAPKTLDEADTGVIIFTSGTTGAPKGIEVTWKKLYDVGVNGTNILNYSKDDVGYVCMPVNHSNSLYLNIMPAMLNGAKILLRRRFSVSNFVKDIEESGTTIWNCVGDPVQYIINYITTTSGEDADFANQKIRTVISTGTNAPNRATFTRMFGLDIFTEVYGSTEAGAITAVNTDTPEYSVGILIKDIRIINENTMEECTLAEIDANGKIINLDRSAGEIVVSQPSLGASAFTGYYRLPEESSKKICFIDGEGFYRMGDLGAITEQNGHRYLIFLGRTGDWIRFKGENWSPVDGEKVVGKFGDITNAGIIGVPQPIGREDDPMFILEVDNPDGFDIDTFYSYCKANLPHYMMPRFIRLVQTMPMTETMKLKKSVLKHEFYYRSGELDELETDIIYEISDGKARPFTSSEYEKEIARFADPTNQDTLKAFTKRSGIF